MRRDVDSPEAYRAALGSDQRALVDHIRGVLLSLSPPVSEGLRYGMLDYPGLANLGAQKRYVALYVAPEVLARHRDAFPGVDAGKSCLRFKRVEDAPAKSLRALLEDVRAFRARA